MKFIQSRSYFLSRHSEKTILNGIELKHRIYEKGKVRVPRNHIQQNWPLTYFILAWPPLSSRKLETSCYCLVPRWGRGYEKINAASTKEQQLDRFKNLKEKDYKLPDWGIGLMSISCVRGIAMRFCKKHWTCVSSWFRLCFYDLSHIWNQK